MKITKIILLTIIFSLFTLQAEALSFSNFSCCSTGSINTGNGYFDDDAFALGFTGSRNVYTITENNTILIVEPIGYASGSSSTAALVAVNSSGNSFSDAVVHKGYLYFINNSILYKKKTRNDFSICAAEDTSSGGCISTISTGVGQTLRVSDGVLYFTVGNTLRHLDVDDSVVSDFNFDASGYASGLTGFTVNTISGDLVMRYVIIDSGVAFVSSINRCTLAGCVKTAMPGGANNLDDAFTTMYSTTNTDYFYSRQVRNPGIYFTLEGNYTKAAGTFGTLDIINTDLFQGNRAYVGGKSTIGLVAQTLTSYETFNSGEIGIDSLPLSEGAGIVQYVNKEIIVPNPTYFNDSIIPFVISLRFVITAANHTNYQDSIFWHVKVDDPRGYEVYDLNLPAIACIQSDAWWDILSLFNSGDYTCDGSGTIYYTPASGQFWLNGTWRVNLTEEIPGTISILSTDTWVITNESANNSGVINPPAPCPTCGMGAGGTINTNTSLQIIRVFRFVAFWGFIIWLGIVFTVIGIMSRSPSGVNGMAVIVVSWLSAIFIALVGLFDPFKIYIIVLSTIIAAVLFRFGKNATTTEE